MPRTTMPIGVYIRSEEQLDNLRKQGFQKGRKVFFSEETLRKIGLANSISQKGKKASNETKLKMSLAKKGKSTKSWALRGENNYIWKGDKASYGCIHIWVNKWKGKPETCEMCGMSGLKSYQINWCNKDHKYRRVLEDYIRLCKKCHRKYDIENNNYNNLRKQKTI